MTTITKFASDGNQEWGKRIHGMKPHAKGVAINNAETMFYLLEEVSSWTQLTIHYFDLTTQTSVQYYQK